MLAWAFHRSRLARASARSHGAFTFIELVIVISLVAVTASMAIPHLIAARKASNQTAAIGALRTLVTAQELFRDGDKDGDLVPDYATTIDQLARHDTSVHQQPIKQGYSFVIIAADHFVWSARADPLHPNGPGGDMSFFVDESGVIRFSNSSKARGTDQPIDPIGPTPTPIRGRQDAKLQTAAVAAVKRMSQLGPADTLDMARAILADPAKLDALVAALDADRDGQLRIVEVLGAEPLDLARQLAPVLFPGVAGTTIGDDARLHDAGGDYLHKVDKLFARHPSECELATVPMSELDGDPASILDEAQR